MAERKLSNWLNSYLAYTQDTESSPIFNKWVGISTIASALRKKTWLEVGRLKVFPNLYIVLVAEPGVARKSQAISYAYEIICDLPAIITSADSGSAVGLMESLVDSATYDTVQVKGVDTLVVHSSLSVISKEFESFLSSLGGSKMLVTLTDLYDAGEKPWKHKTQKAGTLLIPSVFLNILGATTPESLCSSLSSLVFGGGLASRITFVCSETKAKKVPFPSFTTELESLRSDLLHDLTQISLLSGAFQYDPEAKEFWEAWYLAYDETNPKRLQQRKEFNGWYSRKPMLLQKLSVITAASQGRQVVLTEDIQEAIQLTEEVERGMGKILNEVITQTVARKTGTVEQVIKEYGSISEKHLLQLTWRDLGEGGVDEVMTPLVRSGVIKRTFTSPEGKPEIWYHWKEETES